MFVFLKKVLQKLEIWLMVMQFLSFTFIDVTIYIYVPICTYIFGPDRLSL